MTPRARVLGVAAIVAVGAAPRYAGATEDQWHLMPMAEVSYANSMGSRVTAYGGSVGLRYDLLHWLSWEAGNVSWHFASDVRSASDLNDVSYRYNLNRIQFVSSLVLQPPLSWQVKMKHVVPSIGIGAGLRADVHTNRLQLSPDGLPRQYMDRDTNLSIVQHMIIGLEYGFTDSFKIAGHTRIVRGAGYSGLQVDVNAGLLLSVSFYGY